MSSSSSSLPLSGLSLVDFGRGAAAAIAVRLWADAGAVVNRVEPEAGDPFYGIYAAYDAWQRDKTLTRARDITHALELMDGVLANAELCVIGGEDHPGFDWRPDARTLALRYPKLVILQITGDPRGDLPAAELLAQARAGIVFDQLPDRPMAWALPVGLYGAALQGAIGAAAAVVERERSGLGQIVSTSLFEGVLSWVGFGWFRSERSDMSMKFELPRGAQPLIFTCADGLYVHVALGAGTARADLYAVLGIDDPSVATDPRGLPSPARGLRNFYGDIDLLQGYISQWKRDDLLQRLWDAGVPAEAVLRPGEVWDEGQVRHNKVIHTDAEGTRRVGFPVKVQRHAPAGAALQRKADAALLNGLKVVDLGNFTAGPHASLALKDLGADVIRVEALTGDPLRAFFRPFTTSSRGKRAIALNLKHPTGVEILLKLCGGADMVHHNFRPGVTERLGIGADVLRKHNPNLVFVDNSGYGPDGPHAQRGGFDMVFQASCGHEIRAGGDGNAPLSYRVTTIDFAAGLLGSFASLIGEWALRRHGARFSFSSSLLNTGIFLLSELTQSKDGRFGALPVLDREQLGFSASERLYQTGDGWIALVVRTDEMARRLVRFLGLEERIAAPVSQWGAAEAKLLAEAFAARTTRIAQDLAAIDVWAEPCNPDAAGQYLLDPTLVERGTVVISNDPRYGELRQLGTLFTLSRTPCHPIGASPLLGEHTREILAALGYSSSDIDRLYETNVVK